MTPRPFVLDFAPGYLRRVLDTLPHQGDRAPWTNPQNYREDRKRFLRGRLDDGVMQFTRAPRSIPIPAGAIPSP